MGLSIDVPYDSDLPPCLLNTEVENGSICALACLLLYIFIHSPVLISLAETSYQEIGHQEYFLPQDQIPCFPS